MKEDKLPHCFQYNLISKRQAKKGFFYCKLKDENTHINNCEGCKHQGEILREVFKKRK